MSALEFNRRDFLKIGNAAALAATSGLMQACGSAEAQSSQLWDTTTNPQVTTTLPSGASVTGYVAAAYRPVFDEFVRNFAERGEIGASVAITVKGKPVLEAWGGYADTLATTPSKPWQRDNVGVVFSATKGATALCAHLLAARGQLDLNAPVTRYWPEFGANGKQAVTVRMLLDHSAGVPVLRDPVPAKGWADWTYITGRLAEEAPWWEPGADHGYHAVTFGWLIGEVVRRITGASLGSFFDRELAQPLGLDLHIGTPASVQSRISPLMLNGDATTDRFSVAAGTSPTSIQALVFNMGDYFANINTPQFWQAEVPAINGVTNAQALAGLYAVLANGGTTWQGTQLLPAAYVEQMGLVQSASHSDRVLLLRSRFGYGYWNSMDNRDQPGMNLSFIIGRDAFGHPGFGGSFGFADPQANLSMGYTMNRMGPGIALNSRGQSLVDAAYKVLGYTSNSQGVWLK
jgi:CubicO group peptidase (beta-lactamase class C family)